MPPIAVNAFKANAQSTKQSMSDDDYSMDVDDFEDFDEPSPPPMPGPSVPLKGRKRFLADLEEMRKTCVIGFSFHGFDLRSKFQKF